MLAFGRRLKIVSARTPPFAPLLLPPRSQSTDEDEFPPAAAVAPPPNGDILAESERFVRARHLSRRAATPRSSFLEARGLTHHHRYARHRGRDAGDSPARVVLLNHLSAALLVRGDARPADGDDHCGGGDRAEVVSTVDRGTSVRDLTKLHDLTLELTRLRSWRADAERVIVQQARDLRSLQKHKVSVRQERDDVAALREDLATARRERDEREAERDELKSQASTLRNAQETLREEARQKEECHESRLEDAKSEAMEWKTASERAVTESGQETAALSNQVKLLPEENQQLQQELAESRSSNEVRAMEHDRMQQSMKGAVQQLQTSLDAKEQEVRELKDQISVSSKNVSELQADLDESNLAKEAMAADTSKQIQTARRANETLSSKIDRLEKELEGLRSFDEAKAAEFEGMEERIEAKDAALKHFATELRAREDDVEQHAATTDTACKEATAAKSKMVEDHQAIVAEMELVATAAAAEHKSAVLRMADQWKADLSKMTEEHETKISCLEVAARLAEEEHSSTVFQMAEKHKADMAKVVEEHEAAATVVAAEHKSTVSTVLKMLEEQKADVSEMIQEHKAIVTRMDAAATSVAAEHAEEMSKMTAKHTTALCKITELHAALKLTEDQLSLRTTELNEWKDNAKKESKELADQKAESDELLLTKSGEILKCEAEISDLQDQIEATRRSLVEKSEEATTLAENVKYLETQLNDWKDNAKNELKELADQKRNLMSFCQQSQMKFSSVKLK